LPQYGDLFPPLQRYYKAQYSDDMYVGTDKVLSRKELAGLHLVRK